jgi:hypothetical protein
MKVKTVVLMTIVVVLIPLTIHWKIFLLDAWPRTIYVSSNIGSTALLAKIFGLSFTHFKETLYYVLDIISLAIIAIAYLNLHHEALKNTKHIVTLLWLLPAMLFYQLYPYNKLSDAAFLCR